MRHANMNKKALTLGSLLLSSTLIAGTIPSATPFEEGEQLGVSLSRFDFNRVFVEGEKIIKISFPEKTFIVDKSDLANADSQEGSVYLKPVFDTPLTVYFSTDKNHHFSLTVTSVETTGKTVRLLSKNKPALTYVKKGTDNVSEVEEAIALMKLGETPKDFSNVHITPSPFYVKKDIKVILEKEYRGARLSGYVYRIENKANHPIELTTELFSHKNAASLSLSDEQLAPKKIAYLYGLYRNEG